MSVANGGHRDLGWLKIRKSVILREFVAVRSEQKNKTKMLNGILRNSGSSASLS